MQAVLNHAMTVEPGFFFEPFGEQDLQTVIDDGNSQVRTTHLTGRSKPTHRQA